jgi:hypothetical protein
MTFGTTVTVDGAVRGLEALSADLSSRGFMTAVMEGGGPPCVRVVSRVTTQLSENVYAAPAGDGSLWFWWSWAERIAPIGHVGVTADKVARVLRLSRQLPYPGNEA